MKNISLGTVLLATSLSCLASEATVYVYNDTSSQTLYSISATNPSFSKSCDGGTGFGKVQTVNAGKNVWAAASPSGAFIESKGDCHVTTSVYTDAAMTQLIATEENAITTTILASPDGSNSYVNWIAHRDDPVDFCASGWECTVVRSDTNPSGFPPGYQHLHLHVNTK